MSAAPFHGNKPAGYDEVLFRGYLQHLPEHGLDALERRLIECMRKGLHVDPVAIARTYVHCYAVPDYLTNGDVPARYAHVAEASGERWTELDLCGGISLSLADEKGWRRRRNQYLRECRRVLRLANEGIDLDVAWAIVTDSPLQVGRAGHDRVQRAREALRLTETSIVPVSGEGEGAIPHSQHDSPATGRTSGSTP
ncbi:hypothetical protein HW532_15020 [Kaustia mangrovi]|uniref:Uncharacterized protein n=1 Tax=Kaustia mangrovi TaxID=2593653 RepID=A0A7S8C5R8_9HYPH|nr:hypothetical protein [Kaustia mangrovi]QPC43884.1 hypothetical protein HW532_15020 [Kaustia mangrovi]